MYVCFRKFHVRLLYFVCLIILFSLFLCFVLSLSPFLPPSLPSFLFAFFYFHTSLSFPVFPCTPFLIQTTSELFSLCLFPDAVSPSLPVPNPSGCHCRWRLFLMEQPQAIPEEVPGPDVESVSHTVHQRMLRVQKLRPQVLWRKLPWPRRTSAVCSQKFLFWLWGTILAEDALKNSSSILNVRAALESVSICPECCEVPRMQCGTGEGCLKGFMGYIFHHWGILMLRDWNVIPLLLF